MSDHIRYDLLTQKALRGVVRDVLVETAKNGLIGEHHFYISFDTQADGVRLSERMRAQYPQQMTIILQHQYWDLLVSERGFEVGLSFGGVPEKLFVPFDSIKGFFDPSVQFGLQFEEVTEGSTDQETEDKPQEKPTRRRNTSRAISPVAETPPSLTQANEKKRTEAPEPPDKPGGGEVVRLDRFRKK